MQTTTWKCLLSVQISFPLLSNTLPSNTHWYLKLPNLYHCSVSVGKESRHGLAVRLPRCLSGCCGWSAGWNCSLSWRLPRRTCFHTSMSLLTEFSSPSIPCLSFLSSPQGSKSKIWILSAWTHKWLRVCEVEATISWHLRLRNDCSFSALCWRNCLQI